MQRMVLALEHLLRLLVVLALVALTAGTSRSVGIGLAYRCHHDRDSHRRCQPQPNFVVLHSCHSVFFLGGLAVLLVGVIASSGWLVLFCLFVCLLLFFLCGFGAGLSRDVSKNLVINKLQQQQQLVFLGLHAARI